MWGLWPPLPEAQATETRCQRNSWGTDRDQRRRPVEQKGRPGDMGKNEESGGGLGNDICHPRVPKCKLTGQGKAN